MILKIILVMIYQYSTDVKIIYNIKIIVIIYNIYRLYMFYIIYISY